ncbi:cation diffusion facilitator family transporter [Clostridium sp. AN503]|uniref:cation diffusion facilitator family transporter n=1 Tax=Clostridium sp. AN503 TaxID=3160598 RepID=UPI00345779E6
MIYLLAKLFIKDYNNFSSPNVKQAYAKLCSVLGIVINTILFLIKLLCGSISGSTAIVADGFNNLADVATSIATYLGFILACIGAGNHHPFGHGRYEWLMSIFSSLAVMGMGITLANNSIQVIHNPKTVEFGLLTCIILICSILAKFYMFLYNNRISKRVNSMAMKATATDSISDMVSTTAILFSLTFQTLTGLAIDGWCGLLVSAFIIFSGFKSTAETMERFLGQSPDKATIDMILSFIKKYPEIHSISNLVIHDYGLGHFVISMHIEGTDKNSLLELDYIAHEIAYHLYYELNCDSAIQVDILDVSEETTAIITTTVNKVLSAMEPPATLNDFRVVYAKDFLDISLIIGVSRRQQKSSRKSGKLLKEPFPVQIQNIGL